MKPTQIAALLLLAGGALLALLAVTTPERVIVGAMEDGRPIIGRPANKPMLAIGATLAAAAISVFLLGLARGAGASAPLAGSPASESPSPAAPDPSSSEDSP